MWKSPCVERLCAVGAVREAYQGGPRVVVRRPRQGTRSTHSLAAVVR